MAEGERHHAHLSYARAYAPLYAITSYEVTPQVARATDRRQRRGRPESSTLKSLLSESIFEPTEVAHTAQR
jgi:hypothetical protein